MSDTSKRIEKKYFEMISRLSAEERIKMACRMYDTGKKLMKAGIMAHYQNINEKNLKAKLFTKMYRFDLSKREIEKIMQRSLDMDL